MGVGFATVAPQEGIFEVAAVTAVAVAVAVVAGNVHCRKTDEKLDCEKDLD